MVREAIRLNIAEMHLDHLLETEQSRLSSNDLDLDLYREIKRLATLDEVSAKDVLAFGKRVQSRQMHGHCRRACCRYRQPEGICFVTLMFFFFSSFFK